MGLLDRYGVNGEPQPMQVSPLTHDASNDKLARIAVEDPFAETKTRIHNAIIEQQISSGEVVTDDSMRALINEYVEKPEYNIPVLTEILLKSSFMMILWVTALFSALLTVMNILKLWLTAMIMFMLNHTVNLYLPIFNLKITSTLCK